MKRLSMKLTRGAVAGMLLVLSALTSAPAAQAATVYLVDDDNSTACAPVYNGSHTTPLQDAIDDAKANHVHTIKVCGGFYGSVMVNQVNGLTIVARNRADRPYIVGNTGNDGIVVQVIDSKNVVIDGLYVDGATFSHSGGGTMGGIVFTNSTGTIRNNIVHWMRDTMIGGADYGVGIEATNIVGANKSYPVKIQNNMIIGYETAAIQIYGRVPATITGNVIDGAKANTANGTPGHGIGLLATDKGRPSGKVSKNQLFSNEISIILDGVGKIGVTGNTASRSTVAGMQVIIRCTELGQNASQNKISGNIFHGIGILGLWMVSTVDNTGLSVCSSHLDKTLISKNQFTANAANAPMAVAIEASTIPGGTSFVATAAKNKIVNNTAWGFDVMVAETGTTGTIMSHNVVYHK